jgi:hypothetical protein
LTLTAAGGRISATTLRFEGNGEEFEPELGLLARSNVVAATAKGQSGTIYEAKVLLNAKGFGAAPRFVTPWPEWAFRSR